MPPVSPGARILRRRWPSPSELPAFALAQLVACANTPAEAILCPMKLRYDLAMKVTPKMVLEEAQANQHRYKAEPLFSKTGIGSLSSASTKDSAAEVERSTARIQKLTRAAKTSGPKAAAKNGHSSKH
jgi:hypothetical protein